MKLLPLLLAAFFCGSMYAADAPDKTNSIAYAVAVEGRPGYVRSPHSPETGFIDVRGFAKDTQVRDPYSGKLFLVPADYTGQGQSKSTKILPPRDMKIPFGTPVKDRPGYVLSPYSPNAGAIDVRGFPKGTEVMDPYSGKRFLTP
jgi:hypothetical protein